jgi:hypothetical protein
MTSIAGWLFGGAASWLSLGVGSMVGLGIGSALGASEGIAVRSSSIAARGLLIGMVIGAIGGAFGAAFAQAGYVTSSSGRGSFVDPDFSSEVKERLSEAGAHEGKIEVALIWHDRNDLDVHVIDPNGEQIFYGKKRATKSEGWLDIDMNVGEADAVENPVEHIRWPQNSVPRGEYRVLVNYFGQHRGQPDQSPFEVGIKIGNRAASFKGSVSRAQPITTVHTFVYPMKGVSSGKGNSPALTALAVVLGWTLLGVLIGSAEGFRRWSPQALRNASLGGALGGCLGGIVLVFVVSTIASGTIGRLLGFLILGGSIGLFIVLVERALSAVLQIRSGRFEGREIYLDKPEMRIGRNDTLEIYLGGDTEIAKHHATLRREGAGHSISATEGKVTVNDSPISSCGLQNNDVIVIGDTRLVYRFKGANVSDVPSTLARGSVVTQTKAPPPPPPPRKRPISMPAAGVSVPSEVKQESEVKRDEMPRKGNVPPPPPPPRRL